MARQQDEGSHSQPLYENGNENETGDQYNHQVNIFQSGQGYHHDSNASASNRNDLPIQFPSFDTSLHFQQQANEPWNNLAEVPPAFLRTWQDSNYRGGSQASISTSYVNLQHPETQQQPVRLPAEPQQPRSFPWVCPHCDPLTRKGKSKNAKVCKDKNDWVRHMNTHTKPSKCSWERCAYECASKNMLTRHINSVHRRSAKYKCPIENCSHTNPRRDNFGEHLKRAHKWSDARWDRERNRIKISEKSTRTHSHRENASRSSQLQRPLSPAPPNPNEMEVDMTGSDLAAAGTWDEWPQTESGHFSNYDPNLVVEDPNADMMEFQHGASENSVRAATTGPDLSTRSSEVWHEDSTLESSTPGSTINPAHQIEDISRYEMAPFQQETPPYYHLNRPEFSQPIPPAGLPYRQQIADQSSSGAWSGFRMPPRTLHSNNTVPYSGKARPLAPSTTYTYPSFAQRTPVFSSSELSPLAPIPPHIHKSIREVLAYLEENPENANSLSTSGETTPDHPLDHKLHPVKGCKRCIDVWSKHSLRNKHLKRHSKPYFCTSPTCSKNFGSKRDWISHENSQHWKFESWTCKFGADDAHPEGSCEYKACHLQSFKGHVEKCHLGQSKEEEVKAFVQHSRSVREGFFHDFWCGFCVRRHNQGESPEVRWERRFSHIEDHLLGRSGRSKMTSDQWKREPTSRAGYRQHGMSAGLVTDLSPAPDPIVQRGQNFTNKRMQKTGSESTTEVPKKVDRASCPSVKLRATSKSSTHQESAPKMKPLETKAPASTNQPDSTAEEPITIDLTLASPRSHRSTMKGGTQNTPLKHSRRRTLQWTCCVCGDSGMVWDDGNLCPSCAHQSCQNCNKYKS